jgi:hypothetical protein
VKSSMTLCWSWFRILLDFKSMIKVFRFISYWRMCWRLCILCFPKIFMLLLKIICSCGWVNWVWFWRSTNLLIRRLTLLFSKPKESVSNLFYSMLLSILKSFSLRDLFSSFPRKYGSVVLMLIMKKWFWMLSSILRLW